MLQRRRRAEGEDGCEGGPEEEALRQLERELEEPRQLESELEAQARALEELPPVPDKEDLDGSMVDPKERQLATPGRPIGEPVELRPLFSEEQIMALDAVQQQAPHV